MRRGWLCATALIATLLSACSTAGGSPTRSQQPITVTIGIAYAGGSAPGHSEHPAPGTIRLRGPGTDMSRRVSDGQSATFSVQPGEYTATARSGDAQCTETKIGVTAPTVKKGPQLLVHCDVK